MSNHFDESKVIRNHGKFAGWTGSEPDPSVGASLVAGPDEESGTEVEQAWSNVADFINETGNLGGTYDHTTIYATNGDPLADGAVLRHDDVRTLLDHAGVDGDAPTDPESRRRAFEAAVRVSEFTRQYRMGSMRNDTVTGANMVDLRASDLDTLAAQHDPQSAVVDDIEALTPEMVTRVYRRRDRNLARLDRAGVTDADVEAAFAGLQVEQRRAFLADKAATSSYDEAVEVYRTEVKDVAENARARAMKRNEPRYVEAVWASKTPGEVRKAYKLASKVRDYGFEAEAHRAITDEYRSHVDFGTGTTVKFDPFGD